MSEEEPFDINSIIKIGMTIPVSSEMLGIFDREYPPLTRRQKFKWWWLDLIPNLRHRVGCWVLGYEPE